MCVCVCQWDFVMLVIHHKTPNAPSEVPEMEGVELGVGLSVELVTLVFFLHSNAT